MAELAIEKLERASEVLKAISHPVRISIIELLTAQTQMTVTEIYSKLKIEQAVASQHLKILKSKNVCSVEKQGNTCLYSLKYPSISNILTCIEGCTP